MCVCVCLEPEHTSVVRPDRKRPWSRGHWPPAHLWQVSVGTVGGVDLFTLLTLILMLKKMSVLASLFPPPSVFKDVDSLSRKVKSQLLTSQTRPTHRGRSQREDHQEEEEQMRRRQRGGEGEDPLGVPIRHPHPGTHPHWSVWSEHLDRILCV